MATFYLNVAGRDPVPGPDALRAVMYKPTDLASRPSEELAADLERIAAEMGPCDVVFPDIE